MKSISDLEVIPLGEREFGWTRSQWPQFNHWIASGDFNATTYCAGIGIALGFGVRMKREGETIVIRFDMFVIGIYRECCVIKLKWKTTQMFSYFQ